MKILYFIALTFLIGTQSFAQNKLSKSRESGYFTYIYKITDNETAQIAEKGKLGFSETFLHTQVDSFYVAKGYRKTLPFGNYIYLNTYKNTISYNYTSEKNVDLQFINNLKEFQFYLTDLKGKLVIADKVEIGRGKDVHYNKAAQLYQTAFPKKETYIKVTYQGVTNFFTFDLDQPKPYRYDNNHSFFWKLVHAAPINYLWQPFRWLFSKHNQNKTPAYKGYMVFSKPKYKPLDTVKFKAYILTAKGKIITNKTLAIKLYGDKERLLANITPYKDGGYEYQFVLADTLNLRLDRSYQVALTEKVKDKEVTVISNGFHYEDYELKSLSFAVRTDKEIHKIGSPVTVFMKATDENELAVPDGRVKITALTNNVGVFGDKKVFVPDTLWQKSLNLDPVGETKLVLPDSIFPKVSLSFNLNFEFRNTNNENRSFSKRLSFDNKNDDKPLNEVISTLKKDSIYFDYRVNNKTEIIEATIISYSKDDVVLDSVRVKLPVAVKINYGAANYKVLTDKGMKDYTFLSDFDPMVGVNAVQSRDSLRVVVSNENKVPFWYTIFSGNKVFYKGFTTSLDTVFRHANSKAAHISINYYWDEKEVTKETSAFYNPNLLAVTLVAPDIVYPGQQVNMLVKVSDLENKPVANTDVTAFAVTSKFKNDYLPSIPQFGKRYFARKKKNIQFEAENISLNESKLIDWEKWGRKLGLDTIEYYKFTHPTSIYVNHEMTSDTASQIAPFLMDKGRIEPVSIVYIDEIPVFFDQADQLARYSFSVKPGTHSLRLRSKNKMVYISSFEVLGGRKTVVSFNVANEIKPNSFDNLAFVATDAPAILTNEESNVLNKYMLKVNNNFDSEKTTIKADTTEYLLNPPPNVANGRDLVIGPIKQNYLEFKTKDFAQEFLKESGYTYTFTKGLIKQKSYVANFAFNTALSGSLGINGDYKQYALKTHEIDSIWNEYLNLRSYSTLLFRNQDAGYFNSGRLMFALDTAFTNRLPYIKNIIIYKPDEPDFIKIYPGNTSYWPPFTAGNYRIMFLLKDNRYFTAQEVKIKPRGVNYYKWDKLKISQADDFSNKLDAYIKSIKKTNTYYPTATLSNDQIDTFNDKNFDFGTLKGVMSGRIIDAADHSGIPGVTVKIVGLNFSVVTDANGNFSIKIPASGKVTIAYVGYETVTIAARNGNIGDVKLDENRSALEEVVVVGYGTVSKKDLTGSVAKVTSQLLGGAPGLSVGSSEMIMIRGTSSLAVGQKPLILVDGLPFAGDVSSLAPEDILEINVLKDGDATAIYGAKGVNGVIIIKTKKGNALVNASGELVSQQQTMRTNFSDEGFWQPKLITDDTGTAKFSVKFPDDITNWRTRVIAINGRKQSGVAEIFIKSFKSLSANFVSPLFATEGDEINVIGKLMNYTPFEETVNRKFIYNGTEFKNSTIKFKNANIDTVAIEVKGTDSLKFEYTLKQDNGYFDGEIRKIPVVAQGVLETKGYFSAMLRDTSITYNFDKNLGKITLRAESSIFPTLLDEMTKLRNYEYLCNEQLASKLKGLLLEKQVRSYLNEPFKHEKDILFIIKKIQQNKKPQGTWAWWQNGEEQIWISYHVVDALLKAEKQGYKVELNKQMLYTYLVSKLVDYPDYEQIETIKLLHLLDDKYYIKDWVLAYEKRKLEEFKTYNAKKTSTKPIYQTTLFESLQLMELKQIAGIKINTDSLLNIKKQTMFGNLYWGEESNRFWDNSIQNTLLAYKILKNEGKHQNELDKIALYFLEQRKDGAWRNTFESSLILETILPRLLVENKKAEPASLNLNNEMVTSFPYDKVLENTSEIKLDKKGKMPIYFTAYQQFKNPNPVKISKDFTVNTSFVQNGNVVANLKAGTLSTLKVEVEVRADADYVMIEIPIPAGCSYENKMQNFWGVETHREYFKNKTSIFCTKLKQGKYTFNIDLMPRYSGSYILNPAKAEMMYFPVFYGREGMKKVGIN